MHPSLPKLSKYRRCLEPLKAEPQEVFGGPTGIWKTRGKSLSQGTHFS